MSGFTSEDELLNMEIDSHTGSYDRTGKDSYKEEQEYIPPSKRPWWALSSQREIEEEKEQNENK